MRALRAPLLLAAAVLLLAAGLGGYFIYGRYASDLGRSTRVISWIRSPEKHPEWAIRAGERCGSAPFLLPTSGLIGFLWDDSFRVGHRHQGIDIFGGTDIGITPVFAAYPGYLTRMPDWKSSLIIRVPEDPLLPGRQIWTYYTHLADSQGNSFIDPAYPPGTSEVFVEAGVLLGYQGNYSGDPFNPVGVHLHFSIVQDDGQGKFLNELEIENTLDPSPYLGLPVNRSQNRDELPVCEH
jgi:hypothetical protein